MFLSTLKDLRQPYTAVEAWLYDRVVAPAVEAIELTAFDSYLEHVPRDGTLVEVGCGGGQLLAAVAERRRDLSLVGVDLSPGQVARARQRLARHHDRARVVVGSALDLPLASASADAVVSVASIKHWPEPDRGLRECARLLRPGGALLVAEADRGCRIDDAARFVAKTRVPRALRPLALAGFRTVVTGQSFDLEDARELAARAGLADAAVTRVPGAPAWQLAWVAPGGSGAAVAG
ncbi:MAG: class I SAM-dependent methyltransferase [Polyangiaceae bacterium]|nr:class I SAM-dependent methyltransferase [Polyangiaceae bacterium]